MDEPSTFDELQMETGYVRRRYGRWLMVGLLVGLLALLGWDLRLRARRRKRR